MNDLLESINKTVLLLEREIFIDPIDGCQELPSLRWWRALESLKDLRADLQKDLRRVAGP